MLWLCIVNYAQKPKTAYLSSILHLMPFAVKALFFLVVATEGMACP